MGADAYYPFTTGLNFVTEIIPDSCLGNNDYTSFYHYYSFSPCILYSTPKIASVGSLCSSDANCEANKISYAVSYVSD